MNCHSAQAKLPFYSKLPIIKTILKKDIKNALRQIDLDEAVGSISKRSPIGKVELAKIEKSILDGTMPPHEYTMFHWRSPMSENKKEVMLKWVKEHRASTYSNKLAVPEFANEPIQPISTKLEVNPQKAALGHLLFHDTRLSLNNTVSCASCHSLETAGVDNKQFSEGINGQIGRINTPTVFNAVYNKAQFWDGRAPDLAAQASGPPLDPIEMASKSFKQIIAKLKQDRRLTNIFYQVYSEGYSETTITESIAEFEKTLITPNSRFDLYLKGNKDSITEEEKIGYNLFKKHSCATCHVGTQLGGQSYELMGLANNYFKDRGTEITTQDQGRFQQTSSPRDLHRFKVPGLRNIALTAPYYHDGSQKTLRDAIINMAKYQEDIKLTEEEIIQIESFMHTLTGKYNGSLLTNKNIIKNI